MSLAIPNFFDSDKLEKAYLSGWKDAVDIDELCFLAVHSTVLTRIKSREQDLATTLYRVVREGLRPAHITLEKESPETNDDLEGVKDIARWAIWLISSAGSLGLVHQIIPVTVTGALLFSFKV